MEIEMNWIKHKFQGGTMWTSDCNNRLYRITTLDKRECFFVAEECMEDEDGYEIFMTSNTLKAAKSSCKIASQTK